MGFEYIAYGLGTVIFGFVIFLAISYVAMEVFYRVKILSSRYGIARSLRDIDDLESDFLFDDLPPVLAPFQFHNQNLPFMAAQNNVELTQAVEEPPGQVKLRYDLTEE